jgi:hypothetical protein
VQEMWLIWRNSGVGGDFAKTGLIRCPPASNFEVIKTYQDPSNLDNHAAKETTKDEGLSTTGCRGTYNAPAIGIMASPDAVTSTFRPAAGGSSARADTHNPQILHINALQDICQLPSEFRFSNNHAWKAEARRSRPCQ